MIAGYANFVAMVNPEKGQKLKQQVNAILGTTAKKEVWKSITETILLTPSSQVEPPKTDTPDKNWWSCIDFGLKPYRKAVEG